MAGRLLVAVAAWNRTRAKAEAFARNRARVVDNAAEVVGDAGVAITMLENGAVVTIVALQAGVPSALLLQLETMNAPDRVG
jgi:3-hydroxyisobutyrate dehydrogenase-like beta-hydroxyacid dehydrogenase